jgi:membrane associated rhomboid family serine protease
MPNYPGESVSPGLPRPGRVTTIAMSAVGALWLTFTVSLHWAGLSPDVFALFCGNTLHVLHGQVWRLLTAPLMHGPEGVWHALGVVITLYFFGVPMEKAWGQRRYARFLVAVMLGGSLIQALFDVALPLEVRSYFAPNYWFGGGGVASALVVAWGMNNRGQVVRLYGILPLSATVIMVMSVAMPLFYLLFRETPREGVFGWLGACGVGWLLGASTPSPLRRYWLNLRLSRLDAEVAREAQERKRRVERSNLKVIEGGRAKPASPPDGEKGRGPDGRWLN